MQSKKFDFSVKTVVVGDSGVGKTCFLTRFIRDYFDEGSQPTLGVEFMSKIVETSKRRIELQLWDTAGQELFRSVTRGYYRGSAVAFLVFDLTNHASFDSLERWLRDVKEVALNDVVTVLVGNKNDLADTRQVTKEEAEGFANSHKMKYFETSAKTGECVTAAIHSCLSIIDDRADSGAFAVPPPYDTIIFDPEKKDDKKCC